MAGDRAVMKKTDSNLTREGRAKAHEANRRETKARQAFPSAHAFNSIHPISPEEKRKMETFSFFRYGITGC